MGKIPVLVLNIEEALAITECAIDHITTERPEWTVFVAEKPKNRFFTIALGRRDSHIASGFHRRDSTKRINTTVIVVPKKYGRIAGVGGG